MKIILIRYFFSLTTLFHDYVMLLTFCRFIGLSQAGSIIPFLSFVEFRSFGSGTASQRLYFNSPRAIQTGLTAYVTVLTVQLSIYLYMQQAICIVNCSCSQIVPCITHARGALCLTGIVYVAFSITCYFFFVVIISGIFSKWFLLKQLLSLLEKSTFYC